MHVLQLLLIQSIHYQTQYLLDLTRPDVQGMENGNQTLEK